MEDNKQKITASRTVLVTLCTDNARLVETEKSLAELERLVDTAGGVTVARLIQNKEAPDVRTVIGSGKVAELRELCQNNDVSLAVFDIDLSPSQIRNLEDELEVSVIDRSMLILDIFALHAVTGEGKLQVELAQLKYTAEKEPRCQDWEAVSAHEVPASPSWKATEGTCAVASRRLKTSLPYWTKTGAPCVHLAIKAALLRLPSWDTPTRANPPYSTA